ncbi:sulfotransferase domain-containing protein [Blastopirellula marina]|uniref:Sulfotransferase domain-containing protein n=1 Tax=Blastopirellula marina DSM 3645 TaxID=314230 RepID=A3ZY84_9BACT|nr:sulfotransferase domain-containing protein [Blastopirellula marina]EAQ78560.1 hypothetical protein DSM3645_26794 [Blastopirellula marina DSM 3645]
MFDSTEITIVSGLPRSGTSLMMQMLDRGGIPALTDEIRTADTDNPQGYFEYERVKQTRDDPSWLDHADGKVVKMVSSLLYDLPTTHSCRVLFMRRDIDEILDSQEKMLTRLGRPAARREDIKQAFSVHLDRLLQWLPTQEHLQVLQVSYNDLFVSPNEEIGKVTRFLDRELDLPAMVDVIDPGLYRNRSSDISV